MTQELLYDKRGEIGWITFNRPQARNALTFAMYQGLAEICIQVGRSGATLRIRRPSLPPPSVPSDDRPTG